MYSMYNVMYHILPPPPMTQAQGHSQLQDIHLWRPQSVRTLKSHLRGESYPRSELTRVAGRLIFPLDSNNNNIIYVSMV